MYDLYGRAIATWQEECRLAARRAMEAVIEDRMSYVS